MFKKGWLQRNIDFITDFDHIRKRSFFEKFAVVISVHFLDLIYALLMIQVLTAFFSEEIIQKYTFWGWLTNQNIVATLTSTVVNSLATSILFTCILAPLWEEFVFRFYWLSKKLRNRDEDDYLKPVIISRFGKKPIWPVVIMTSIIFGIAHGGPVNLFLQGVGGALLAYTYLRNGRCFWSAVWQHALWNGTIVFFVYTGAWKSIATAITLPYWLLLSF